MKGWPIYGMYQPDAIEHYTHHGVEYLIMSNEGDSKDYAPYFEESIRVQDIDLSSVFGTNRHFIFVTKIVNIQCFIECN